MVRVVGIAVASLLLAACKPTAAESALRIIIDIGADLQPECVRVKVKGGSATRQVEIRPEGRKSALVGVRQTSDLPGEVEVSAEAFGPGCTAPLAPVALATAQFVPGQVVEVTLALRSQVEADRDTDGYVDEAAGGDDCNDLDPKVHPGITEAALLCANGKDDDCDGRADCAAGACQSVACDDKDECTTGDVCGGASDGGCGGAAKCKGSSCIEASCAAGECSFVLKTGSCSNGNGCIENETCQSDGGCGNGAPKVCAASALCTAARCDEDAGACVREAITGACDDGNSCTFGETCLPDAGCGGVTPVQCPAPQPCLRNSGCALESDGGVRCLQAVDFAKLGKPCAQGSCSPDGACRYRPWAYTPSNFNLAQIPDSGIAPPLLIDCPITLVATATSGGQWSQGPGCDGGFVAPVSVDILQPSGVYASLVTVQGLTITQAGSLRVQGGFPIILAVLGNADIQGPISARSTFNTAGAGASATNCSAGQGRGGDGLVATSGAGAGGGGFASRGGDGGAAGMNGGALGGAGGMVAGTEELRPLIAGCAGGNGGNNPNSFGLGGGGFQLSVAGILNINAPIDVGGAGGRGASGLSRGGGGGGSGGAILIEAWQLLISNGARLAANGGAGGAGSAAQAADAGAMFSSDGGDGADGERDFAFCAEGGRGGYSGGGDGGFGACPDAGATAGFQGQPSTVNSSGGGGAGGGGLGRIRLNAINTCVIDSLAVLSGAVSKPNCP